MKASYANAKDVLPKELYEEVKKHFTGTMYVSEKIRPKEKRKLILALCKQDMEPKEIASIVGLSIRRTHQIISEERDKRLSDAQKKISAVNGYMGQ
jgi:hypothetical protein